MMDPNYVSYGVQPQNPFVSAHGYANVDPGMKAHGAYGGSAYYPSGSTAAHSGAYPASYMSSSYQQPAYHSHAAAPVPAQMHHYSHAAPMPSHPVTRFQPSVPAAGHGMIKAAVDADHGSVTAHVQQHGNSLYPEMVLRLRPDGSRGADAHWPEQALRPRQAGEKVTSEPKYVEPDKSKTITHLNPPPDNADELMKHWKEPASMGIVEKILAPHHALEDVFGEHGPHGVLLHGVHKGLHPVSRLYDYGPRRIAYRGQVPVAEPNPGVIINREFEIHEHHRFVDSPHKFQLMCHDDDCIRNENWQHMGQLLRRPEDDEDSDSELKDELKNHADWRLAGDLRGLRRMRALEQQRARDKAARKRNMPHIGKDPEEGYGVRPQGEGLDLLPEGHPAVPWKGIGAPGATPNFMASKFAHLHAGAGQQEQKKGPKELEHLKGGVGGHQQARIEYHAALRAQRALSVTAGFKSVHHDHVEVAEDLTGFFKNSEEVFKEFVDFEDD